MNEEIRALATILRHQKMVSFLLRELAREFERRADLHDMSKLQLDELEGFVEINRIARQYKFGSKEYKETIGSHPCVKLHYSRNTHHPEYHQGGVRSMGLIDFMEMVIDWTAATKTYGNMSWEEVIQQQKKEFPQLSDCQLALISLIKEFYDESSLG